MSAITATRIPVTVRSDAAATRPDLLHRMVLALFIGIPLAALVAAVPVAWGWGLSWADASIAAVMYLISGHGITVGYHRLFTHRSFRAATPVRIALAVAGSMALQGRVTRWVADHRKHHRFSDRPGDPPLALAVRQVGLGSSPRHALRARWLDHRLRARR